MVAALGLGAMLAGCDSGPGGTDIDIQGGTYMTARIDGTPWQAVERVYFFVGPPGDTALPGASPRGLIGVGANQSSNLDFMIAAAGPDSVPLENVSGKSLGEFTKDGNTFFTRSGYVKIARVSDSLAEGTFECELRASDDSADPGKMIRMTEGKFLAKLKIVPGGKTPGDP